MFPLPLVDDCLGTLAGNVWFSKLNANSASWQINIKTEDSSKTAFHMRYGLYEHVKMGFGFCNAQVNSEPNVLNLINRPALINQKVSSSLKFHILHDFFASKGSPFQNLFIFTAAGVKCMCGSPKMLSHTSS